MKKWPGKAFLKVLKVFRALKKTATSGPFQDLISKREKPFITTLC